MGPHRTEHAFLERRRGDKRADVYANRDADKLAVSDTAILLKPHKEARAEVELCLYDGGV